MLLVVSVAYGQSQTSPQQGPAPKTLSQKADGHFTANKDAANPEKFEVYTVKAGDTLSVIAGSVLKNPRLWPQLWEQNEHIVNPHWIYPNDKILIKPIVQITQATPPPAPAPLPPAAVEPPPPAPPAPVAVPLPPMPVDPPKSLVVFDLGKTPSAPEIKLTDMYCSGFIRKASVPQDSKITAKYNATGSALAVEGDYIYFSQGSEDGVRAGNMYQVVRPTRHVEGFKGETRVERDLGMHYLDVAQIQVVTAQPDFSMAKVVQSCEALELGDLVIPYQKYELPKLPTSRPFSPFMTASGLEGSIVITRNTLINYGSTFKSSAAIPAAKGTSLEGVQGGMVSQGSIVYVDLGQNSGVKAGDILIVFKPVEVQSQLYPTIPGGKKVEAQRMAVGELVILKVGESAATALVTYSSLGLSARDSVARR